MAGNEWINGYLEAILDSRAQAIEEQRPQAPPVNSRDGGQFFNPTKYFVEEVVTGVDETDLHRTWIKVVATRNSRERNSRLENMCWRIWHLTRKKKQLEWEVSQRQAHRRWEREQGRRDATEDLSEDLSEGEKGDGVGEIVQPETPRRRLQRNPSIIEIWSDDKKENRLYIVLISLHGLVRGEQMELGRDSDTGGQVKYVVELARALAKMPGVYRVDLFTRQICSPEVDWSYAEPTEMLTAGAVEDGDADEAGESSGAYIIRIPFGPRDKYLRKELLWPHIQEFVDGALAHILNMSKVLGEQIGQGKPVWPYVIHGHYADAGDSAALLSGALNVPMVLTGHSLGRDKLEQLLKQGRQSKEDINSTYKIMRRIEAEELSLDAAELVITSTRQEIDEQWGLYDGFDVKLEKVLRARSRRGVNCHGRFMPRMAVIPPGMDFTNVVVQEDTPEVDGELSALTGGAEGSSPKAVPTIWSEVMRFFTNPHKPMILALSRPDPKKNITTLLKAFGECRPLRELANLTLIMGNRDDIEEMSAGNASVLTTVLKLIDKYDLYGLVAYPKHHKQSDVPDIYRLAAKTKGVFINPALVEPFGLTLIEAAAHGLPMVATKNGGPVDIHRALGNGLLVDPHDQAAIANALLKLVSEKNLWMDCRKNGWKNIHLFSWPEHCRTYLTRVAACRMRHPQWQTDMDELAANEDESSLNDSLKDVQDMSLRLSVDGDKSSLSYSVDPNADPVKQVMSQFRQPESETKARTEQGKKATDNAGSKYPVLRRRGRLVVFALDCYDENGAPDATRMIPIIQNVIKAARSDAQMARNTGFAISTSLPLDELTQFMKTGKMQASEFDALICSSGSQVYYPGGEEGKLLPDQDYATHIDYRWGNEGLKNTVWNLMNNSPKGSGGVIEEDRRSSNEHCVAYSIRDRSKVMRVEDLRQKLRLRGLRCHPMYCRNSTRYLFVRWRLNVANMYVVVGESGDTDYEELISGAHRTVIVKGLVAAKGSSDELLRSPESDLREDIVPSESPFVGSVKTDSPVNEITNLFKHLSKATH
ncbi:PREDICTED: probable sucrose-phosphate synthase 3 isoform X2 [Tarenaya hassleriana]|uniref:probable sucrose-phosphate synthase 3 isoform X2 n=1 Tax=Tarenaya hassleriana TaxID=28532 RepID=UPI00053C1E95|nr:PREDICTED: probable sucrose-phosphate synthase 3 isoform X2 [Tarenaya hassleriana]